MEEWKYMEAIDAMTERRSVRSFSDRKIPEEVLARILKAGLHAASGGNLQPWSVIVERDPERSEKLGKLLKYPFVEKAPVNLLFLLDWYKLAVYSRCKKAPFAEHLSTNHFFIAWDDTVLSAQAMETAAWLSGIGSCFIGHIMDCSEELKQMYHLPALTFPALLLSMGYPKKMPPKPRKLTKEMMIFEGVYPDFTDEEIIAAYDRKYENREIAFSDTTSAGKSRIDLFRKSLLAVYREEEAEQILREALERGYLTEIQRLFGIHYHPGREIGGDLPERLRNQGLFPF